MKSKTLAHTACSFSIMNILNKTIDDLVDRQNAIKLKDQIKYTYCDHCNGDKKQWYVYFNINVFRSSQLSINKLKCTGDYVLKAWFEPMIFNITTSHVPATITLRLVVSLVGKIKLCVNVFLNTVKDRDIAQFTNFDLLSDTFNMGYM